MTCKPCTRRPCRREECVQAQGRQNSEQGGIEDMRKPNPRGTSASTQPGGHGDETIDGELTASVLLISLGPHGQTRACAQHTKETKPRRARTRPLLSRPISIEGDRQASPPRRVETGKTGDMSWARGWLRRSAGSLPSRDLEEPLDDVLRGRCRFSRDQRLYD